MRLLLCFLSLSMKESDCWGSHLNRSALPTSSPKLTSQDRDSLKASSQYYGLKLKNNLSSISKVRITTPNSTCCAKTDLPAKGPYSLVDDHM